jgi:hypothetical protein
VEACQIIRIPALQDWEELQRDGMSKPQIVGAVDLAHSPIAHLGHNPISPGKDCPGHEPLVGDVTGQDSHGDWLV